MRIPLSAPRHAGLVLAAGASTRMGQPKALLKTPAGIPLAEHQARLLEQAGGGPVVVVLGCEGETIREQIKNSRVILNPDWDQGGRLSSVQAGLRALEAADGIFILPVDTVGVRLRTLQLMREYAEEHGPPAIRPLFNGRRGQVAWIAQRLKNIILEKPATPDTRLDELLSKLAEELEVHDPAIVRNINTPEEWARVRADLSR